MTKNSYSIGESIPLGEIPKKMYAFINEPAHHGEPITAFHEKLIDMPVVGPNDILIKVEAAGINYNGVWGALGEPHSPTNFHGQPFHVGGSDASGIVWKIGDAVDRTSIPYKEGDHVIAHCGQYCGNCPQCNGGDPMLCKRQKIWGYETSYGSFAQFSLVKPYQLMPKPDHLNWAEAASYMLVLATAWRMLYGHYPHNLKPSHNVLVWGAAGGLGSMAIQIIKNAGANAIAMVSSEERGKFCLELGAKAYINRKNFDCWGPMPKVNSPEYFDYLRRIRKLRKVIWEIIGVGNDVDLVFEHVGEQTFPVSCYLVKKGGMVAYCGATSGFNLTMDAAYGWMHQKRVQGSHFASTKEANEANEAVKQKFINPVLSETFAWSDLPKAHQLMRDNKHKPGCMAVIMRDKINNLSD